MFKPPLLLLHGFRGNHIGLAEVANYLGAAGYSVFVPDIPPAIDTNGDGFKDTELPREFFTPDGYAGWVREYMRSHHIINPVLIGHSMGSIIAAAVAEKTPELLDPRIVFLAPISVKPPKAISNLSPLTAVVSNKPTGYVTTQYLIVDRSNERDILKTTYECAAHVTSKNDVARAAKFSSEYAISNFQFTGKKALFVSGEKDRIIPLAATAKLAKKVGGVSVVVPGTGHLLNYEKPRETAIEILKFLKEENE